LDRNERKKEGEDMKMNLESYPSLEELLEKAKQEAINECEKLKQHRASERKWLIVSCDSYCSKNNRVELLILEGSPPRAMILVNYPLKLILVFDMFGRRITTLSPRLSRCE
jgi:hypothetical protein